MVHRGHIGPVVDNLFKKSEIIAFELKTVSARSKQSSFIDRLRFGFILPKNLSSWFVLTVADVGFFAQRKVYCNAFTRNVIQLLALSCIEINREAASEFS